MAGPTSGIVSGAGLRKEDVNYRQHEKRSTCMHFYPLNSCDIVDGNISPDGVCNKWEIRPAPQPKDGQYYMDEYRKSKEE